MAFSLQLFGVVSLEGERGPLTGPAAQRHRLAVLALLAVGRPGSLSRDKLVALLWPERDVEHARGLLNQAVHALRRSLGADAILSAGDELQLNPALVSCDVLEFETAIAGGKLERAAALYAGPFLDGFFLKEAGEFERWAEQERDRLAAAYAGVLEMLAEKAGTEQDLRRAVELWKSRAQHDPYDSRVAVRLMLALDASGNRAAALSHAESHQRLLRDELGIEPSPEVQELAERLRASPVTVRSWHPVEPASPRSSPSPAVAPSLSTDQEPASRRAGPKPMGYRYAAAMLVAVGAIVAAFQFGSGASEPRSAPGNLPPGAADEIARAVARELDLRQNGDTAVRLPQHRTRSIPAYELYLRGNDPALIRNDTTVLDGLEYFRRAIELDSNYAAAWAGLARLSVRVRGSGVGPLTMEQYLEQGERAARRALALDDSLADAHGSLGLVRVLQWDLPGAESHLKQALALDPATPRYHEWMVRLYVASGRPTEAMTEARQALERDPLSPSANAEMARALLAGNRCNEALSYLEKVEGVNPPLLRVPLLRAQCYARRRMWVEALAQMQPRIESRLRMSLGLYGYLLTGAGRREEAYRVIDTLKALRVRAGEQSTGQGLELALVYAGLGNADTMAAWLERGIEDGSFSPFMETVPTVVLILDSLRHDRRVAALRRRMGLESR